MARVVSLKRNGAGWVVRLVRENNPESRSMIERLGFAWRPELGALGAYATDNLAVARALLDLEGVCLNADRGVEEEIRSRMAAISVTGDVTETIVADQDISVTAGVAETPRVEMEAPALDPADAMRAIPVTGAVTEMVAAEDGISVTAEETETPAKHKRGRPPKADGAMTAAERARRYRRRHAFEYDLVHAKIYSQTLERAEKLAAERGISVAGVINQALDERTVRLSALTAGEFGWIKTAAAKSGEDMELIVSSVLGRISESEWDEIAAGWIHYRAGKAKEAQPEKAGVSDG